MTLFKQITIIFSLFIMLIIGSVMYLNFNSSTNFIQNQIYSSTEDTTTSLGLSLSMNLPKNNENLSTLQTIINAIFDRGYYEYIILKDTNGNTLIENKNKLKVKNVPDWFLKFIHIKIPVAKTQISSGWLPYGTLSVKINPGHAYLELWNIFVNILKTFAILVFIALFALYFLLSIILKSLKKVEEQAKSITNNDFIIQKQLPYTTEFRNVVISMNKMVKKVKYIFEQEASLMIKYNKLLYNDQETNLGNRKLFLLKLSSLLEQNSEKSRGIIILISFNNYSLTKEKVGYERLSTYIKKLSSYLYEQSKNIKESNVSRLKENEFIIILPETNYDNIIDIVEPYMKKINDLKDEKLHSITDFYASVGINYYNEEDSIKDILSRTDFALLNAKMKKTDNIFFHDENINTEIKKLGKREWFKIVENALSSEGINLSFQSVKDTKDKIFHKEAYLRIKDAKGVIYPASIFIPILNSLNKINEIDKKVIELAIELSDKNTTTQIALNISPSFVNTAENLIWLEDILKQNKVSGISFEASNYNATNNLKNFENLTALLQKHNCAFGIDNFDIQTDNLNYLQALKPTYIKANKSFYIDMQSKDDGASYQSFKMLCASLDIKLIATAVESQEEVEILNNMNIKFKQGRFIEMPTTL